MQEIVRCPFCVLRDEFRPMVAHIDGRYICDKCGHITLPRNRQYECRCPKCERLRSRLSMLAS